MSKNLEEKLTRVINGDRGINRNSLFARMREDAPVIYSEALDAWVVTRHNDVRMVLRDSDSFRAVLSGPGAVPYGRTYLHMEGKEHAKKVGIVARRIRSRNALRGGLSEVVHNIARNITAKLPMNEPTDLRREFAVWIPLLAIDELIRVGHGESLEHWYRTVGAGGVNSVNDPAARKRALEARAELENFLAPIILERRTHPGEDLVSALATTEYEGKLLEQDEVIATVIFLLAAGVETTERVLSSMLRRFALEPELWQWLRDHRDDEEKVVELAAEGLRYYPPVNGLMRRTIVDTQIGNVELPAGQRVCLLLVAANRDPEVFSDPQEFRVERFEGRGATQFAAAGDLMAFGGGTHYCVGARLAQEELRYGLQELSGRVAHMTPVGEMPPPEGFMLRCPPSLPVRLAS